MQEINDNVFLEKQQDIITERKQEEDEVKERSVEENIQVIKNVKEIEKNEEINKKAKFLREKGLNENVIETLIDTDFTDKHVSDDDSLQNLWQANIEINKSSDSYIINSTFGSSSSNDHVQLSSNSIYLKKVLGKPLIQALCEIVAKKPVDPVEYLGHWLLHYKICEERTIQQKERELELSTDREELKLKKFEDEETIFDERKNEEEHSEDQDYLNYGEL